MKAISVKPLRTLMEKMKGLMGADPVYPVYFTTRWGIHTFGVLSPIDVLILDDAFRVVLMYRNMKPNRIFIWPPLYNHVIELPAGGTGGISKGEKIELKESQKS